MPLIEKRIQNPVQIERALTRISHEILERNGGGDNVVLVGMHSRGVPLAQRISTAIERFEGIKVPVGKLDIGMYRDDISEKGSPLMKPTDIPSDINGKTVVIIDDVLYTGRSIRDAMDAISDFGRPSQMQLGVLVDRGHRDLPIRADYGGKNVPTAKNEDVQVRLMEIDGADEIVITTNNNDMGDKT